MKFRLQKLPFFVTSQFSFPFKLIGIFTFSPEALRLECFEIRVKMGNLDKAHLFHSSQASGRHNTNIHLNLMKHSDKPEFYRCFRGEDLDLPLLL